MNALGELDRELTTEEYELLRRLIYDQCGINLGAQKQQLVRARLGKLLRQGAFHSYREYYEHVRQDGSGAELGALIDAISTNTTHLFRERQHFDFLAEQLRGWLADARWTAANTPLRIWSAGCSSGDEPYSIAMTVDDVVGPRHEWKILATDISSRVLQRAQQGVYDGHRLGTTPPVFRQRYFAAAEHGRLQVAAALRRRITFARLNLMQDSFPFRHGFNVIFCRNVMIYFDRATQERLVAKYTRHLRPGGYLLIGHSESLNGINHELKYVRPTIYQRSAG